MPDRVDGPARRPPERRDVSGISREVITLAFYGELTHTEIATALGLPTGTVKGRMRLGLHKLRKAIDLAAA